MTPAQPVGSGAWATSLFSRTGFLFLRQVPCDLRTRTPTASAHWRPGWRICPAVPSPKDKKKGAFPMSAPGKRQEQPREVQTQNLVQTGPLLRWSTVPNFLSY